MNPWLSASGAASRSALPSNGLPLRASEFGGLERM